MPLPTLLASRLPPGYLRGPVLAVGNRPGPRQYLTPVEDSITSSFPAYERLPGTGRLAVRSAAAPAAGLALPAGWAGWAGAAALGAALGVAAAYGVEHYRAAGRRR